MPVFDAKSVSIFYASFRAVTDVSLTIYEHESRVHRLVGSGKPRWCRGVETGSTGSPGPAHRHMDGEIDDAGASRVRLGRVRGGGPPLHSAWVLFQKPNLFPSSTHENVADGPCINGTRKKSHLDEIVESSLEQGKRCGTR